MGKNKVLWINGFFELPEGFEGDKSDAVHLLAENFKIEPIKGDCKGDAYEKDIIVKDFNLAMERFNNRPEGTHSVTLSKIYDGDGFS